MITTVHCPSCSTGFPVDSTKVPEDGVNVRCSVCSEVFFVEKPDEAAAPGAAPTDAPTEDGTGAAAEGPGPGTADEGEAPPHTPGETAVAEAGSGADQDATPTGAPALEEEAAGEEGPEDWVIEREPDLDPADVDVEPMDTVEEGMRRARGSYFGEPEDAGPAEAPPTPGPGEMAEGGLAGSATSAAPQEGGAGAVGSDGDGGDVGVGSATEVVEEEPPAPPEAEAPATPAFTFGKRDPHEKASRLARVLVSDIVTYNPERHQRALENDSLKEDFEEEIRKSWEEYVDQVGKDLAESTDYFNDALNEILARGRNVF